MNEIEDILDYVDSLTLDDLKEIERQIEVEDNEPFELKLSDDCLVNGVKVKDRR